MTTLIELRDMLEKAEGPSRELDERIWAYDHGWDYPIFGSAIGSKRDCRDNGEKQDYTDSIDATLALAERLLPVSWIRIERLTLTRWQVRFEGGEEVYWANAPTAPLAILKALIAALIAKAEADHG